MNFLDTLKYNIIIVNDSFENDDLELNIRDNNDKPVLKAALLSKADILITGDKDFLQSDIRNPRILKPVDFLNLY